MKRKPNITKPRYSEQILPVSWPFNLLYDVPQYSEVSLFRGLTHAEVKKIVLHTNDFVK